MPHDKRDEQEISTNSTLKVDDSIDLSRLCILGVHARLSRKKGEGEICTYLGDLMVEIPTACGQHLYYSCASPESTRLGRLISSWDIWFDTQKII